MIACLLHDLSLLVLALEPSGELTPCPSQERVLLYAKRFTACNLQFFVPYPGSIRPEYAQIILAQVNHLESPVNCRSLPANKIRAPPGSRPRSSLFSTQSQR
jgi:hypothetical protein